MKEEDRLYLFFGWSAILIAVVILMGKVTYEMDQLNKKIDAVSKQLATTPDPIPEVHTVTDATPTEPEEVSISIRPEYLPSENAQKVSEGLTEDKGIQLTTEQLTEVVEPSREYLGTYELTAYAWTGSPCANGNYPTCGYTIASNSIPMGSRVYIEGYGEYVVEDCGGMADNVIDVYMGDYDSCIQFGRRTAKVYLLH